jgi:hypothetical protein
MILLETVSSRRAPFPGTTLLLAVLLCLFLPLNLSAAQESRDTAPPSETPPRPLFTAGSDNARFGPFQLRGASPFQLTRVSFTPLSAEWLAQGQFLLNTSVTWNNRWAYKHKRFFIDGEFLHFSIAGTYGVTDWLQLRLEIPFGVRGGGCLDGFIMGFHDAFGYAQAGRDLFPVNRFRLILWRKDGTLFMLGPEDAGAGMEDLVLTAKFRLFTGSRWLPLAYAALQMKIPTGSEAQLWGSGCLAGAVSVHMAERFWSLYLYLDLQYTRYASDDLVGISMEQNQASALFATEWSIIDRISLLLQLQWHTGSTVDFYEFSKPTYEVGFGLKALIARETILSFSIVENIFFYDNSPDIAFYLGVSHRF